MSWVNPAYGTAGARRALRAASTEAEESAFRRAKPKTQLRKPKVYNLGKSDSDLPITPSYAGRANFRSGTAAVGKRMTGQAEGVAKPKRVQPPRDPARRTPGAGMSSAPTMPQVEPNRDRSKPPIHPSLIGKGLRTKIIESSHDLAGDGHVLQTRVPGVLGRLRGQRRTVMGGHNLDPLGSTARPRASRKGEEFGETMYDRKSRVGKGLRASNAKAILTGRGYRNPRFARNAATHERLHGASLADPRMRSAQPADRMLAHENHDRLHKPFGSRSTEDLPYTIGKRARRYDPEDRRQRRLGAAGATLAGGGAGLTAWGAHGAYRSTRNLRAAGAHLSHLNEPGAEIRFQRKHHETDKAKGQVKGRVAYNRVADAKETAAISALSAPKNRPLVVGASHSRRVGGGLALIGAGAAVAHHGRSRANRRYN